MTTLLIGLLLALGAAQAQDERIAALERTVEAQRKLLHDWGGLTRYGSENTEIAPPKPGENRVVFLGNGVTEFWGSGEAKFFPGKPYFNRGIARQKLARGQLQGDPVLHELLIQL